MPLHVKEFIIQAKFENEEQTKLNSRKPSGDIASLKEDIISECMEKLEEYLRKRERR
jgi:hypothetical protein